MGSKLQRAIPAPEYWVGDVVHHVVGLERGLVVKCEFAGTGWTYCVVWGEGHASWCYPIELNNAEPESASSN